MTEQQQAEIALIARENLEQLRQKCHVSEPFLFRYVPMFLLQRDVTSREICKLCFHVNPVGFNVPNDIWIAVVPEHVRHSVVCLSCFARLGDEKAVPWDMDIQLFPVSLATHLNIDRQV